MKRLATLLLAAAALAATPAAAQTIKSLGYNTTNGEVVYTGTNTLTFTNEVGFGQFTFNSGQFFFDGEDRINLEERLLEGGDWSVYGALIFGNATNAATTRTNLGLGLPALTNTSNVTMMRALAGVTNTNQPFTGSITFKNEGDDVFEAVFSNGIMLSVQEQ